MKRNHLPPIAIVSAAGIFPGARDLDQFWQNIRDGVSAIRPVPPERWQLDPDRIYAATAQPDKARSLNAGLIDDFSFEPGDYALPAETIDGLDPMHQLVLQTGRMAWQNTRNETVDPDRVDVILAAIALPTGSASHLTRKIFESAVASKLFPNHSQNPPATLSRQELTASNVTSFPAALLGAALNLGGGTLTLDAACASSLFAIKLACDVLQNGQADAVLAGGVARPDILYTQIGFTQLQALSRSGHCAPFDGNADGLVVGEGCGIVVLKRLEDALRQGDDIRAVIRGMGLSNDMRGNLLAPDSEGQLRAMRSAYAAAGWQPSDVDLIECHGAGTPVGDTTELNSLMSLWGQTDGHPGQCAIGSIKSMIGHLLTAAGVAGLIKVLLGLQHKMLPPSLNFSSPAPDSPLQKGPFRVQTRAVAWNRREELIPRRAAVSAFGFGGINAHLLLEEWPSGDDHHSPEEKLAKSGPSAQNRIAPEPIAIVGMETLFGPSKDLRAFQRVVLKGQPVFESPPPRRWKNCEELLQKVLHRKTPPMGAFLNDFQIDLSDFRIPPKEIADILPQHLLMLKVALAAMRDAGMATDTERPGMGCIIGMEFDLEDTNFHLRWDAYDTADRWNTRYALGLSPEEVEIWGQALADAYALPLTHTRTLGSLGGLIASRIAREFHFGGPSFVLSDDAASGLKALNMAAGLLAQRDVDSMLVGAVDLPADLRRVLKANGLHPDTRQSAPASLDRAADGSLNGEGAAAIVIKRLADAQRDNDRIYAIVTGFGNARKGVPYDNETMDAAGTQALSKSLQAADTSPEAIGYLEAHGSGIPTEDKAEWQAIATVFGGRAVPLAIGALKACLGHTGSAAGLASLVKTALCLYQQILPGMQGYQHPPEFTPVADPIHIPIRPVFWPVDRTDAPRRANVLSLTCEGNAAAVTMEEVPANGGTGTDPLRTHPLGHSRHGLFVLAGETTDQLKTGLDRLKTHLDQSRSAGKSPGAAAAEWHHIHRGHDRYPRVIGFSLSRYQEFDKARKEALAGLANHTRIPLNGLTGCCFTPHPLGSSSPLSLVYPGSGNHYIGMGRQLSLHWPDIWRRANQDTDRFAAQCRSDRLVPYRLDWSSNWTADALAAVNADPTTAIYGQVVFGCLTTTLLQDMGIQPSAVIGYSLGETVGYFATGAWPDRGHMLERLESSDLFQTQLAGPCRAVRQAFSLSEKTPVDWRVAVINRPVETVRHALNDFPLVSLLIINTPTECVIGGHGPAVEALIRHMSCEAVFLAGVVAVHCKAVEPVAKAYRDLHRFPTAPPSGLAYYSCAENRRIRLTEETAADSLLRQALNGFDFAATVEQAYADGLRVFLEVGPQASCTRMISQILGNRPHLAISASPDPENEMAGFSRALAIMAAEGLPVDLDRFFPPQQPLAVAMENRSPARKPLPVTIDCGGRPLDPPRPGTLSISGLSAPSPAVPATPMDRPTPSPPPTGSENRSPADAFFNRTRALIQEMTRNQVATSDAHQTFLALSEKLGHQYAQAVELHTHLIHKAHQQGLPVETPYYPSIADDPIDRRATITPEAAETTHLRPQTVAFDRDMCMEFAIGSVAKVLGPEFAPVDRYKARVRLPDEPLMLVDRILSVEGEKGVLGPGRLVTEHDVRPDAWYLDGDRAPVCISVEAGQADLFLSAYLGIDLEVKGERTYRLLDAAVTFHRGLPRPGDVIRYTIEIEKFIRQGPTWMFFFQFDGTIDDQPLITMRNGCAGFFTEEEVRNSGGIILTEDDLRPQSGILPEDWQPPVAMTAESYDAAALQALRAGDPAACFGQAFRGIRIPQNQRLPGGRMSLIDRVLSLDPAGGRYGIGSIRAEADIHPDDWFLTCHFVDDMVMPGTLMYECCAHTLRIYLQRMGWLSDRADVVYEPVVGRQAVLKCRGPVTAETRHVIYEVEICELGFAPEPFVIADAHMYADGHRIVMFRGMTMKMTGLDRQALESFWKARNAFSAGEPAGRPSRFTRAQLREFAIGRPSRAFGTPYLPFDSERFIARLPAPPYAFIDRVTRIEPPPWVLAPGGWVETECDTSREDWHFRSNGAAFMPICILMEIALQACGFLAAYMGSALQSERDLHFRNLDGEARLQANVRYGGGPVTTRTRLQQFSAAGDLLIQHYVFEVRQAGRMVYEGETSFGFFTPEALAHQVGLPDADWPTAEMVPAVQTDLPPTPLEDTPPLAPDDPHPSGFVRRAMPSRALRMIDRIDHFLPDGGPHARGYLQGSKTIDPQEWYFTAHFFQDPVCPGSLGIESLVQLLRFAANAYWPEWTQTHEMVLLTPETHTWRYRGQIVPANRTVEVEAMITERTNDPHPMLKADGYLKCDGLYIYKMQNFGLRMIPRRHP